MITKCTVERYTAAPAVVDASAPSVDRSGMPRLVRPTVAACVGHRGRCQADPARAPYAQRAPGAHAAPQAHRATHLRLGRALVGRLRARRDPADARDRGYRGVELLAVGGARGGVRAGRR